MQDEHPYLIILIEEYWVIKFIFLELGKSYCISCSLEIFYWELYLLSKSFLLLMKGYFLYIHSIVSVYLYIDLCHKI